MNQLKIVETTLAELRDIWHKLNYEDPNFYKENMLFMTEIPQLDCVVFNVVLVENMSFNNFSLDYPCLYSSTSTYSDNMIFGVTEKRDTCDDYSKEQLKKRVQLSNENCDNHEKKLKSLARGIKEPIRSGFICSMLRKLTRGTFFDPKRSISRELKLDNSSNRRANLACPLNFKAQLLEYINLQIQVFGITCFQAKKEKPAISYITEPNGDIKYDEPYQLEYLVLLQTIGQLIAFNTLDRAVERISEIQTIGIDKLVWATRCDLNFSLGLYSTMNITKHPKLGLVTKVDSYELSSEQTEKARILLDFRFQVALAAYSIKELASLYKNLYAEYLHDLFLENNDLLPSYHEYNYSYIGGIGRSVPYQDKLEFMLEKLEEKLKPYRKIIDFYIPCENVFLNSPALKAISEGKSFKSFKALAET